MKLSVVAPLYNSAPYIEELCRRSATAIGETGADDYEIILVNDGSPDDSLSVALRVAESDPHVTVIDLSRNFGQHPAILTGMEHATGDLVFVMDSDLEEEPEWISLFHSEMQRAGCDVVFGISDHDKSGPVYALGRRVYHSVLNALSSVRFPENVCTARLMTRRYVDAMLRYGEREVFLAGIWHVTGFAQMPVSVLKRENSPTSYGPKALVKTFLNSITAFSVRPLLLISAVGLVLSAIAFLYLVLIIFQKLVFGISVDGWVSVMAANLGIGGVMMIFNGIIAIYVGKIFIEVKQRPRSIIRDIYAGGRASPEARTGKAEE